MGFVNKQTNLGAPVETGRAVGYDVAIRDCETPKALLCISDSRDFHGNVLAMKSFQVIHGALHFAKDSGLSSRKNSLFTWDPTG